MGAVFFTPIRLSSQPIFSPMLDAVIKGFTLGLLLAISVGPIVFTVIKQSLNNGLKGGFAFITGIFLSDVFLVACCNFFTQFFKALSNYDKQLGIAGSILLIAVGVYFLFFKKVKVADNGQQLVLFSTGDYARMFFAGAIMNLLNPGIIVFWFVWATAYIWNKVDKNHCKWNNQLFFVNGWSSNYATTLGNVTAGQQVPKHERTHALQARAFGPLFYPTVVAHYAINTVLPDWLIYHNKRYPN